MLAVEVDDLLAGLPVQILHGEREDFLLRQ